MPAFTSQLGFRMVIGPWIQSEPTEAQSCNYTWADGFAAGLPQSFLPLFWIPAVLQSSCCTLKYATLPLVFCENQGMVCWMPIQIVGCVTREPRTPSLTAKRCHPRLRISQHCIKCVQTWSSGLCNCSYTHTTGRLQASRREVSVVGNHLPSLRL